MRHAQPTDPRWDTLGQALGLFLRGHTLRTAIPTASVVGTVLCGVNQGATLAEGEATTSTWVRMVINYLVPFVVASVGYLGARRGIRRQRICIRASGAEAMMNRNSPTYRDKEGAVGAADLVTTYHQSWTHRDMQTARSCLADDLDFQGPIDTFSSADDFITTLTGFAQMLTRVDLLQQFHTDDAAALLYDCVTTSPAGTIRTAEFFGLRDGKIASIRLVFDATALRQVMNP